MTTQEMLNRIIEETTKSLKSGVLASTVLASLQNKCSQALAEKILKISELQIIGK